MKTNKMEITKQDIINGIQDNIDTLTEQISKAEGHEKKRLERHILYWRKEMERVKGEIQ